MDEAFINLTADQIVTLGTFLYYLRRRLRIEEKMEEVNTLSLHSVVAELWGGFVKQPGRVHPQLIQNFAHIIGIHSPESFRQVYADHYIGKGSFADSVEKLIPAFSIFSTCLRQEIKNNLMYFLSRGDASFSGDFEVLDDALSSLKTLDQRGLLTEEEVDKAFFNNQKVSTAIDRLDNYAFSEDNSLLRAALVGKFTNIKIIIDENINSWKERFAANKIELSSTDRDSEVFIPKLVINDVFDSFLHNIIRHAFNGNSQIKAARIIVEQQLGSLLIRFCDTGKGIAVEDIERRPGGGIRRSELLIMPYGGKVRLLPKDHPDLEGFSTVVEIQLMTKEGILWREP